MAMIRRKFLLLALSPVLGLGARVAGQNAATPDVVGAWAPARWPAIVAIHTHLLPNGQVLAWDRGYTAAGTELTGRTRFLVWDPATGRARAAWNTTTNLFCSGHAFLPDGRLLVVGGQTTGSPYGSPHTNIYDYRTNSWTRVGDTSGGRWYPSAAALANGEVLVASGNDENGVGNSSVQAFGAGGWRSLEPRGGDLYPWLYQAPRGGAFYAGPGVFTGFLDAGTGGWRDGPQALEDHGNYGSSVMFDGKVMNIGGGYAGATAGAEVIDLGATAPAWRRLPSMAFPRRNHNATLLPDGTVVVTGGQREGAGDAPLGTVGVREAELYDPATEAWTTLSAMSRPRAYHSSAVLLPDGRVLVAGSGRGAAVDEPNAEIYSPPYLFKGPRPTIAAAPETIGYGQRFPVQTPEALEISAVRLIRLGSTTHSFNMNQRLKTLPFAPKRTISVPPDGIFVRAPNNANVVPPGHYLLFLVNGNGVPSVAKTVLLG